MSTNMNFYVERYNRKNKVWDALIPTVQTRDYSGNLVTKKVFFWEYNGTHEIFSILQGDSGYENEFFARDGVPDDLSAEVKAIYDKDFPADGEYTGCWEPHYCTLADLYVYYLENKEVPDYEAEWDEDNKKMITNPIWGIIERVIFYLEALYDEWDWKEVMSDVRLVYWFDN